MMDMDETFGGQAEACAWNDLDLDDQLLIESNSRAPVKVEKNTLQISTEPTSPTKEPAPAEEPTETTDSIPRTFGIRSENKIWECDKCTKVFSTKQTLFTHKKCHSWNYQKCPKCPRIFSAEHTLKVHMQAKHNATEEDVMKEIETENLANSDDEDDGRLLKPIKKIKLIKYRNKYVCEYCGNDFLSKDTLEKHFGFHASNNFELIRCDLCLLLFTNKVALEEHRKVHFVERIECTLCTHRFTNDRKLRCHMERYHSPNTKTVPAKNASGSADGKKSGRASFLCNICGKSMTTKTSLISHNRLHSGEKPYKCVYPQN